MNPMAVLLTILALAVPASAFAQNDQLELLYPRAALQQGVGGVVTVGCSVRDDGGVACEVLRESPEGMGFGDAVLAMSQAWRMPTQRADGAPTAGGRLTRSVEFSPGPPPTVQETRVRVENPYWERTPSAAIFSRHYPRDALRRGVSGTAVLDCRVNDDHSLACEVDTETPAGYGFGQAALRVAEAFRMAPATRDGAPTAGGRVRVPLRFNVVRN